MTAGATRKMFAGQELGPRLREVRLTQALDDAIEDEICTRVLRGKPGATKAAVVRDALLLGLRAMGQEVVYQ